MATKPTFQVLETQFTNWVKARALHDPRYAEVFDIYQWAKSHHVGFRDNGDPEFIHPLRLAIKIASLTDRMEKGRQGFMPDALDLLKASLCHDMLEDKGKDNVTGAVMDRHFLARKIGARAAEIAFKVSRKYIDDSGRFVRKTTQEDHNDIRSDAAALLLKHIDRNDNLETMVDFTKGGKPFNVIYTPEKQKEKLDEANTVFLQASLDYRVRAKFGEHWVRPMNVVRRDLKLTYSRIMQRIVHFQIMNDIDAEHTYGVRDLTATARFPGKSVVRQKEIVSEGCGSPVAAFGRAKSPRRTGGDGAASRPQRSSGPT